MLLLGGGRRLVSQVDKICSQDRSTRDAGSLGEVHPAGAAKLEQEEK